MRKSSKKIAAAATLIVLAPTFSAAQTGGEANTGGWQLDIGFSTGLTYDSNLSLDPDGDDAIYSDTMLTFGLSSVTATQRFDLILDAVLRYIETDDETSFGIEDPGARLAYVREGADSRLTLEASYSDVDLDFLDPFDDPEDFGDDGSLESLSADLRYDFGLEAPFGMGFALHHDQSDYTDTTDPDLYDDETDRASVEARFRLNAASLVTFGAARTLYDADDLAQTDRTTDEYTLSLRHELDAATVLDASIGYADIETEEFATVSTVSGGTGVLGVTRELTNGTASARLETGLDSDGRRTDLTFGRAMDLPSGRFEATLGASRAPSGDTDVIGSLEYTQTLRTGELTASLSRTAFTDDDSDSVLETRARLGYRHDVNALSHVDVALEWSMTEDSSGGVPEETEFAALSAAYTRAITSEWNVTGGVAYRQRDDTTDGDADSSSVYVTLSRDFSIRP